MFAATDAACSNLSLKVTEIAFEALTETGRARPAPYMARAKWVMFDDLAALDAAEVEDWLKTAHGLVAAKLTRKAADGARPLTREEVEAVAMAPAGRDQGRPVGRLRRLQGGRQGVRHLRLHGGLSFKVSADRLRGR